jgi:aquaporin related protein
MNVSRPQIRGTFVLPGMKKQEEHPHSVHRLPFLNWLPRGTRNHFVAMCGEFTGTFLFLFFAFSGTQVANTVDPNAIATPGADTSRLLYISLAFGFSLGVNAWVFFRISGGLFNPAVSCPLRLTGFALIAKQVTLGMCLVGAVPWVRGSLIFIAQLIGGIAAAGIVEVLFPGGLLVRTTLDAGTSVTQGLFIEMFLTAQLVFTIFMLAAEKHKATFIAPVGIGLSLFIAELSGVRQTPPKRS